MIYTYLFEAKSIQNYLFKSGKLKDVIAASERLDSLIDDTESSLIFKVLASADLISDLLDQKESVENNDSFIRFIRCKGGAFYCYSNNRNSLKTLRSSWTLTIQQLFPGLEFTDALTSDENLQGAMAKSHMQMAADRNTPVIKFPIATAITQRYPKTGQVAVPISSSEAKKESKGETILDSDTHAHREAYHKLKESSSITLQNKFTPEALINKNINYPVNLEEDFNYCAKKEKTKKNKEAIRDMALIHIDGNGLGVLLRALQDALKNTNDIDYCHAFRSFSKSLANATQYAAQQATLWLYEQGQYQLENSDKVYVPMRPLVLGGDDVTLLCRADLALEYSQIFCREFQKASKSELKEIHEKYLSVRKIDGEKEGKTKTIKINNYLTASGGILYHKASHPFTHSHHLVEGLCEQAKKLSKSTNEQPAALAFYRLSNTALDDINTLFKQSQQFSVQDLHSKSIINLAFNAYLVEDEEQNIDPNSNSNANRRSFDKLKHCIQLANQDNAAFAINKWRQMATQISLGNKTEADRIYHRAKDLAIASGKSNLNMQQLALAAIAQQETLDTWYWSDDATSSNNTSEKKDKKIQSIISDILMIDHFTCTTQTSSKNQQETS